MNKFLVTYDLVGTTEASSDYQRLIERIKKYPNWGKVQKSVWLISTPSSHTQIRDELLGLMDGNDRLLVAELTGTAAWQNSICKNDWLRDHLTRSAVAV